MKDLAMLLLLNEELEEGAKAESEGEDEDAKKTALANVEFNLSSQGIPLLFFLAIVPSPFAVLS
jgi:hypothetical protein